MAETEKIETTPTETKDVQSATDVSKIDPSESTDAEKQVIANLKREREKAGAEATDAPSEGIISKIKSLMTGKSAEETKVEATDIPDDFTAAATEAGWSEEEIIAFASNYKDDELKEMISFLTEKKETVESGGPAKPEVKDVKPEVKPDTVVDKKDDSELKTLKSEVDTLKKALDEIKKAADDGGITAKGQFAEEFLDKASESFEVFGKGKDLAKFPDGRLIPTSPQYKARAEVLGYALKFHSTGSSWDNALVDALACYKGKHLEKDVERATIKRLKADAEKLSPNRYNKVTEKTYQDETEREADVVVQAARKAGVKKFD